MSSLLKSLCSFVSSCNPLCCCFSRRDRPQENRYVLLESNDSSNSSQLQIVSVKATSIFDQMREDLEGTASRLSHSEYSRAVKTIKDMEEISDNLPKIRALGSDELRNQEINEITHSGAEGGFSSNAQVLAERINVFTTTYLKAKERGDLQGFFGCFNKGDPCLSGRSESLYKYAATLDGHDVDSIPDPEVQFYLPGTIFAEHIMKHFDEELEAGTLSAEMFAKYVMSNLESIAGEFTKSGSSEKHQKAFLEFLSMVGIYRSGDKVDWKTLIGDLAQSRNFEVVFRQSMNFTV